MEFTGNQSVTELKKAEFSALAAGYEFPASEFSLEPERVAAYLDAVGSDARVFEENGIIPPMAVAALSMLAMMDRLLLPPGTIHVNQALDFMTPARPGARLTSKSGVKRKVERGGIRMLTIKIDVEDEAGNQVLAGETSLVIPPEEAA